MSNQGARQAAVRAITSTTRDYQGDFGALFDLATITAGPFNARLLAWLNTKMSTSHTSLPAAQHAFAVSGSATHRGRRGGWRQWARPWPASSRAPTMRVRVVGVPAISTSALPRRPAAASLR